MTLAYTPRLVCLVLACFFLAYAAMALPVAACARRAIRKAESLEPAAAARFVLALRLTPLLWGAFCAIGLCAPSYLWFEPERVDERVGMLCLSAAAAGLAILTVAAARATLASLRSLRFLKSCRRAGSEREDLSILLIGSSQPLLVLAGILKPRVIVSQALVDTLDEEQLRVVLSHERAHLASWDNVKRLFIFLTPGFSSLERAWVRFSEFAADDQAVAGDERRAVSLASALVTVARFGPIARGMPAATPFLGNTCDLSERVDRLLAPHACLPTSRRGSRRGSVRILMLAACLAAVSFNPITLRIFQSALEGLIR